MERFIREQLDNPPDPELTRAQLNLEPRERTIIVVGTRAVMDLDYWQEYAERSNRYFNALQEIAALKEDRMDESMTIARMALEKDRF